MEFKTTLPDHIQVVINDIDKQIYDLQKKLIPQTATEAAHIALIRSDVNNSIIELSKIKSDLFERYSVNSIVLSEEEYKNYISDKT